MSNSIIIETHTKKEKKKKYLHKNLKKKFNSKMSLEKIKDEKGFKKYLDESFNKQDINALREFVTFIKKSEMSITIIRNSLAHFGSKLGEKKLSIKAEEFTQFCEFAISELKDKGKLKK